MEKHFSLKRLRACEYKYISFSLTSERLDNYYRELEVELAQLKVKGKVLFDLISSNGLKSQRYASIYFNGAHLDLDTFKNVLKVDSEIEQLCLKFYKSHYEAIENSVLTKPQRFLFKKKLHKAFHTGITS